MMQLSVLKERIATYIYNSPNFYSGCKAITRNNVELANDLMQETIIIVMNKPHAILLKFDGDKKQLQYCFFANAYMQYIQKNSDFYRTYRRSITDEMSRTYYSTITERYEPKYDYQYKQATNIINQQLTMPQTSMEFYHAKLFELYIECGSFRKAAKEIGIPAMSVFQGVKQFRDKLKKLVND